MRALVFVLLFDRDRIHRRTDGTGDWQRRRDQEKLVHAVAGAIGGQLFEIENLSDRKAHLRQKDLVERMQGAGNFVRPHFHAPRIGGDRGDFLLVDPFRRVKRQSSRITACVIAPAFAIAAERDVSGADEQHVAASNGHLLRARRPARDRPPKWHSRDRAMARA